MSVVLGKISRDYGAYWIDCGENNILKQHMID